MLEFLDHGLQKIDKEGLRRNLRILEGHQGGRITIDGKDCINLCSNNYLGLANNPCLQKAALEAISRYGCGSGASRLVCGNSHLYDQLERRMARFKRQEAALVYTSGYAANIGILTALAGREDIIFSDKLNHASIVDAAVLSRACVRRYPHKDTIALFRMVKEAAGFRRKFIITDTVFSMDGDFAPLAEIVDIAERFGATVIIDEAHATGVLGENRSGLAEHLGVADNIDVHMGTFSKAFGALGGYVAGKRNLIEYLINTSRPLIYTTALPASILACVIAALDIIEREQWRVKTLWENVRYMRRGIIDLGFNLMDSESQILPILIGSAERAVQFSEALFKEGIYLQAIRSPTVPPNKARLRLTVVATHKKADLDRALAVLADTGKKLGIID